MMMGAVEVGTTEGVDLPKNKQGNTSQTLAPTQVPDEQMRVRKLIRWEIPIEWSGDQGADSSDRKHAGMPCTYNKECTPGSSF